MLFFQTPVWRVCSYLYLVSA